MEGLWTARSEGLAIRPLSYSRDNRGYGGVPLSGRLSGTQRSQDVYPVLGERALLFPSLNTGRGRSLYDRVPSQQNDFRRSCQLELGLLLAQFVLGKTILPEKRVRGSMCFCEFLVPEYTCT
jgi:hypothetical protein